MAVGGALAVLAGVAYWYADGDEPESLTEGATLSAGEQLAPEQLAPEQLAVPPPSAGVERTLLLHGVQLGPTPSAEISMDGVPRRAFGVGDMIAEGFRVSAIALNRVVVNANGRQLVLTIDPRSGRPGDRVGLDPEPATLPQLSGAEIERRQAAAMAELIAQQEAQETGAPVR